MYSTVYVPILGFKSTRTSEHKNIKYTELYCFTSKSNTMLDCFFLLSFKSTMTTLHNPDNLQTRWSDMHGQVLPALLALLEIPA